MARIVGNNRSNTLPSDGEDYLYGRGGNDILNSGGTIVDRMIGGAGNDSLNGGAGNDWLMGGFDGFEGLRNPLSDNATQQDVATWVQETLAPVNASDELVADITQSLTTDWRDRLPDSPLTSSNAGEGWTDETKNALLPLFHPGADQDLRFYGGKAPDTEHFPMAGQQATYYEGKLITDGPGAGTPDLVSAKARPPYTPFAKDHGEFDVVPYNLLVEAEEQGLEEQGLIDQPAWLLYHELGWAPKNLPDAEEYWGFDGNDTLSGGTGSDTYVFGVGGINDLGFHVSSGQDTIQDAGAANENDRILIYGADLDIKPSIEDYCTFTPTETDLQIDFNFRKNYEEGSVVIKNMNDPAHQVESLGLVRGDYVLSLDLLQKFNGQQSPVAEPNSPPAVTASNQTLGVGEYHNVSSWFSASDSDGDAIDFWAVWDNNSAPTSGYFRGDGFALDDSAIEHSAFPAVQQIRLTSEQLASLEFGGATEPGTDTLAITAWDGVQWGEWAMFDVLVA